MWSTVGRLRLIWLNQSDDLYQRIEQASTERTRAILVSHLTSTTGQIFPVKRICQMGRDRKIEVVVDGAHAFALEMSRAVEATFDWVEYRLALSAREQQSLQRDVRVVSVTPFRASEVQLIAKRSTQQPGIARIAA